MRAPYLIRIQRVLSCRLICAVFALPSLLTAQSNESSLQYKVGEVARDTIIANEVIRVTDTSGAASQRRKATQTPAIYAYQKSAFQQIETAVKQEWHAARASYLRALERVFGKSTFRNAEINSEPFAHFINNFQSGYTGFPFSDATARQWATGSSQDSDLQGHLAHLREFMSSYFIRPDNDSFSALGIDANVEVTTIEDIPPSQWSDIEDGSFVAIPFNQFLSLSKAQSMFAQLSSANDRAQNSFLSRAIEPNTLYLEEISEERWKNSRISGANEVIFNPGDVIVKEGETITPIIKEALDIMVVSLRFERLKDSVKIELAKEPRSPPENSANGAENNSQQETPASKPTPEPESRSQERERPQGKLPPLLSPTTVAQNESATSAEVNQTSNNLRKNVSSELAASSSLDTPSVMSSFTRWMIGLLLLIVVGTLVFLHFRKGPPVYVPAENPPALIEDRKQNLMKALASQLTQTLFKQRQELLKSKEEATAQVAAMEDRLAKLQPEIFDKLAAYEKKIKELEAQLEQRGVSKEMMNQGLETGFARPIFDDATGSVEGEENLETEALFPADDAEDDKEVPFPGHVVADDLDEDGPSELLEEVLEDLEAESGFEQRIAKGSDR